MRTSSTLSASAAPLILGWILLAPWTPAQCAETAALDSGTLDQKTAEGLAKKAPYSPYAGRNFPTQPYFGDTHLHTSFSMDAGAFGARLDPKDAYRFARGEQVTSNTGQPVK